MTGCEADDVRIALVSSRDLWVATDRITQPQRTRLLRDDGLGQFQWVTLPSLWLQLVEAIESGAGRHTRGVARSKAPADAEALSLTVEIATAVRDTCIQMHIKRYRDVPRDLRQIVSFVIRTTDQFAMRTTRDTLRTWAGRIRTTISNDPDRTWRMHGAACRVCSSTTVQVWDEDDAEHHLPALIVHSEDGVIDKIECSFCGTVLTGGDLTKIILDTLKKPGIADGEREAV